MAFKFPEENAWRETARMLWHRGVGGSRNWHNRVYAGSQSIERDAAGFTLRWNGRGQLRAGHVGGLDRRGETASILASGPSVRSLDRLDRLFERPVACVNGSPMLAKELGKRAAYYIVSDHRFILDKPELFRLCTRVVDAVVLSPMSAFAALFAAPDAVEGVTLYLLQDLRRPFKKPRPRVEAMRNDPCLLSHPARDLHFSCDPNRGTCPAGTVVYDALQLLFGIGYRELFMFGVDLSAGPRFYREDVPAPTNLTDAYERSIEPAFELVREYLRRFGRRLVNGSPGSRLPESIVEKAEGNDLLTELAASGRSIVRAA